MKIHIDLRGLTQKKLNEAIKARRSLSAGRSECTYTAPCIIGTLMTTEERDHLKNIGRNNTPISDLISEGLVILPSDQHGPALELQRGYDLKRMPTVERLVKHWSKKEAAA